jgi:hypothetical protein
MNHRLLILLVAGGLLLLALAASSPTNPPQPQSCPNCPVESIVPTLAGASDLPISAHTGVVLDLPPGLRTKNWGGGSCVHASNVNLLKWTGQYELAEWWRHQYSGGEYGTRLVERLEAAGLKYAYCTDGDPAFLEWCCRTRRGAGIFYKPAHSINCVGMDDQYVYLLDNNATTYPEDHGTYERVPREQFFQTWKSRYGGFGWTLVYQPGPARPAFSLGMSPATAALLLMAGPDEHSAVVNELHAIAQDYRKRSGKAEQQRDAKLDALCQRWAEYMASTGRFHHGGGENIIAYGYRSPHEAMVGWANSPGHNHWLLSNTSYCGWGYAVAPNGTKYWAWAFSNTGRE